MSSREYILSEIRKNQATQTDLPDLSPLFAESVDLIAHFKTVLGGIGGHTVELGSYEQVVEILKNEYPNAKRIINHVEEIKNFGENNWLDVDPHSLEDVDLAIISGHFGVAENGSIWITDELMGQRVAPFICQQLVVIIRKTNMVSTMHHAYQKIAEMPNYNFATFLAGPSKTADIEQSLVLGAHGARGLLVILID